jgi:hypothetical protein
LVTDKPPFSEDHKHGHFAEYPADALHGAEVRSMQLHLTMDEFELMKRLTEDEGRLSCDATPSLPQISGQLRVRDELEIGRNLVGKGLSRNLQLGFDELEDLADFRKWRRRQLMSEIRCLTEPAAKNDLERQLFVLEHFIEKVTEACAMV